MKQSVPKRRHIKFRHRGITQKKTHNIQNTAKVWNQVWRVLAIGYPLHSPVSPSLPLPCVTVCHYISTGLYLLVYLLNAEKFGPDPCTLPRTVWVHHKPSYKLVRDAHNDETERDFWNSLYISRSKLDSNKRCAAYSCSVSTANSYKANALFYKEIMLKKHILRIRCGVLLTFLF